MNRRKLKIFPWSVGLVFVLMILCLMTAVGSSFARYQTNQSESLLLTARNPVQVYLGTTVTDAETGETVFDSQAVGSWETTIDSSRLAFTVANGTSTQAYTQQDQRFSVRLVGSLGIWDGSVTVDVTLRIPKEAEQTDPQFDEIQGTGTRIQPETPLYRTYGDGWVFSFLDEDGEEMTWLLEGETFSSVDMTVILEGTELTDPSLLQPVITGYFAD